MSFVYYWLWIKTNLKYKNSKKELIKYLITKYLKLKIFSFLPFNSNKNEVKISF